MDAAAKKEARKTTQIGKRRPRRPVSKLKEGLTTLTVTKEVEEGHIKNLATAASVASGLASLKSHAKMMSSFKAAASAAKTKSSENIAKALRAAQARVVPALSKLPE